VTNEETHRLARERGVSPWRYAVVRGVFVPFMRFWWGLRISDADRIPAEGPAIITPSHKSFFDSFFLAAATKRHLRFMGKSELFEGRFGKTFVRLGAFPVRRGESDAEALETARVILEQGDLLSLFPEGTRVRDPEGLGVPKRGAVRLALESGAPLAAVGLGTVVATRRRRGRRR
jgi:1-acyl-sn-glycerol-3-phosphate acyltransferase